MGGPNKLLADLGGKPVVTHVTDAIAAAGLPALLVTGNMAVEVAAAAPNFPTVHAPDYAEGLSRSLRAGVAAVPADWEAVIVCLGDMPGITPALLEALATRATPSAIVVPTWGGGRGNPVLWGRNHFPRLMTLQGDAGGKPLLAALADRVVEVVADDAAVLTDVDTPAALEEARSRFKPSPWRGEGDSR